MAEAMDFPQGESLPVERPGKALPAGSPEIDRDDFCAFLHPIHSQHRITGTEERQA